MIFLACTLLTAFALVYTLYVRPEHLPVEPEIEPELEYFNDKKKVIYENLRDLNLEYRMGKLSDNDYAQLKAGFQLELARLMKQMDDYAARRAFQVSAKPSAPPGTCARCGHMNPPENQFCGRCGARLSPTVSA